MSLTGLKLRCQLNCIFIQRPYKRICFIASFSSRPFSSFFPLLIEWKWALLIAYYRLEKIQDALHRLSHLIVKTTQWNGRYFYRFKIEKLGLKTTQSSSHNPFDELNFKPMLISKNMNYRNVIVMHFSFSLWPAYYYDYCYT